MDACTHEIQLKQLVKLIDAMVDQALEKKEWTMIRAEDWQAFRKACENVFLEKPR